MDGEPRAHRAGPCSVLGTQPGRAQLGRDPPEAHTSVQMRLHLDIDSTRPVPDHHPHPLFPSPLQLSLGHSVLPAAEAKHPGVAQGPFLSPTQAGFATTMATTLVMFLPCSAPSHDSHLTQSHGQRLTWPPLPSAPSPSPPILPSSPALSTFHLRAFAPAIPLSGTLIFQIPTWLPLSTPSRLFSNVYSGPPTPS